MHLVAPVEEILPAGQASQLCMPGEAAILPERQSLHFGWASKPLARPASQSVQPTDCCPRKLYRPGSQARQRFIDVVLAYRPARHARHFTLAGAGASLPRLHSSHRACPDCGCAWPALQGLHCAWPGAGACRPALQGMQAALPS